MKVVKAVIVFGVSCDTEEITVYCRNKVNHKVTCTENDKDVSLQDKRAHTENSTDT